MTTAAHWMTARVARRAYETAAVLLGLTAALVLATSSYAARANQLTAAQAKLISRIDDASEHAPHALTTYPAAAQSWYGSLHPAFSVHYEHGKVLSWGIAGKSEYGKHSPSDGCWQEAQKQPAITEVTAATVMLPGPHSVGVPYTFANVNYTFPKRGVIQWRARRTGGLAPASGTVNYNPHTLRIMSGTEYSAFPLSYRINYATVMPEPKIPPAKAICLRSTTN